MRVLTCQPLQSIKYPTFFIFHIFMLYDMIHVHQAQPRKAFNMFLAFATTEQRRHAKEWTGLLDRLLARSAIAIG